MSVIRKVPFIEQLLGSMSETQLKKLKTIINSGGGNVDLSFATLTNTYKNDVTPVYFHFEDANVKTAILIWNNTYCALICYHRFPDLALFKLDTVKHTYEKVNEYCDINELRRVLDDTFETKGTVDSGDANANTVPVADGNGGTEWTYVTNAIKNAQVSSGDAVSLLGFDSEGNVVKDELPEGIVVDETLDTSSTNAIANKPVAEAIEGIENSLASAYDSTATYNTGDYVIYENQLYICKGSNVTGAWDASKWEETNAGAELGNKANKNGNYPTMTTGLSDNLTPYDSESGDDQDEPFIIQATGTANGTQPDFATGSYGLLKEKRGNSMVLNQWFNPSDVGNITESGIELEKLTDGKYRIHGTATADVYMAILATNLVFPTEHKLLINVNNTAFSSVFTLASGGTTVFSQTINGIGVVTIPSSYTSIYWYRYIGNGATIDYTFKPEIIDLTQWFNGNIPADLISHPENFFRYYQGSLAYNVGELVNSNGRYIKCVGRQLWDEEWEANGIAYNTGLNDDTRTNRIRSKNYIKVVPNDELYFYVYGRTGTQNIGWVYFYDKDQNYIDRNSYTGENPIITIPSNCVFIRFETYEGYGTTYNNNVTLSHYYSGESGYDQHYDYELLTNTDTGDEVLLAFDKKTPDGTIYHNTNDDITNAKELAWTIGGSNTYAYVTSANLPANTKPNGKVIFSKLDSRIVTAYIDSYGAIVITFSLGAFADYTEVKNAFENVSIQYEVATPTTEQGTPFSPNLAIEDFGTMEWDNTSFNGVPQGNLIFYPVDYKAFLDTLYDRVEGTPSEVVVQSELSGEATTRSTQDTILQNAIGGTLRQLLATSQNIDFNNTAWIDLESLTWTYNSGGYTSIFVATINDIFVPETGADRNKGILCSKYDVSSVTSINNDMIDKSMLTNGGAVYIKDTSFGSDVTAFKNAMKGVLLAYKKASE